MQAFSQYSESACHLDPTVAGRLLRLPSGHARCRRPSALDNRRLDGAGTSTPPKRPQVGTQPGPRGPRPVPRSRRRPHLMDAPHRATGRCTGRPLNTHCTVINGPAAVRIST